MTRRELHQQIDAVLDQWAARFPGEPMSAPARAAHELVRRYVRDVAVSHALRDRPQCGGAR